MNDAGKDTTKSQMILVIPNNGDATQPKCMYIDTIDELSAKLSSMKEVSCLVNLLAMTYKIRNPSPTETCHLETLLRTMCGRVVDHHELAGEEHGRDEIVQRFSQFLNPVLNGLAGLGEPETKISAFSDPVGFRELWSLDGRNLLTEANSSDLAVESCQPAVDITFVDAFVKDGTMRVALTCNRRMLALVPGSSQVGDEVWFLGTDNNQPSLVRKGLAEHGLEDSAVVGDVQIPWLSAERLSKMDAGELKVTAFPSPLLVEASLHSMP
jgi:hypothetical protein